MARGGGARGVVVSDAQSRLPGGVRGARAPCPGAGGRAVGAARFLGRRGRPCVTSESEYRRRTMQLVRPTSNREFITKFGAVLTMVEFVGRPFEQRSPAACVPQYVLIGASTIPSCFRVVPSLAGPESESRPESRPLALVSARYSVGVLRHAFNGCGLRSRSISWPVL